MEVPLSSAFASCAPQFRLVQRGKALAEGDRSIGPDLSRLPGAGQLAEGSVQAPSQSHEPSPARPAWIRIREIGWPPSGPCLPRSGEDSCRARSAGVADLLPNSRSDASASPQGRTVARTIPRFLSRFAARLFFPLGPKGHSDTARGADKREGGFVQDLASLIAIVAFCTAVSIIAAALVPQRPPV